MKKQKHTSMSLPPECDGVNPCTDQSCQRAIARQHEITEAVFQSRLLPDTGAPLTLPAPNIEEIMSTGTCGADAIAFDQNVTLNAELKPIVTSEPGTMVAYSFPLFKGILSMKPTNFNFSLANGGTTGRDVIFSVEFEDDPTQYYDCTSLWP
jgi:hypothetical protein